MVKFFQLVLLLMFSVAVGQSNFQKIDSTAISKKYKGDLNVLVHDLIQNHDNDYDKARAIYSWITENISYDYKLFNKGRQTITFNCKTKNDCLNKKQEFENKLIDRVLRKKKGICSGYSLLFKRMCDIAKLKCLNIDGYVKTKANHIGNVGILDHAWNAVIIDNQTYFIDLTWASGYCGKDNNGKLLNFVKQKNDFYWFTPHEKFIVDHFPKNPDKVQNFDISKEDYKNQAFIENSIIPYLEIENPREGIIKPKVGDSIVFRFKYSKNIKKLQVNTNLKRNPKFYYANKYGERIFNQKPFDKQEYINFKKTGDLYEFSYDVENKDLKYIEILFDYDLKLKYLVRIDSQ